MKLPIFLFAGFASALLLGLAGCATARPSDPLREIGPPPSSDSLDSIVAAPPTANLGQSLQYPGQAPPRPPSGHRDWHVGQPLMQGFFGVSFYDKVTREGGNTADVDGDSGDLDQMPILGGGAQWKLGGENTDFGFEALFSLEGQANAAAFAVGGGGAAVAVDVDLLIIDMYGGPFISRFVGDKMRIYAGAGPLLQFANYDQDSSLSHDDGSGFGVGGYVRGGIEMILPSHTMIGLGALWMSSNVDLSGNLGDLEVEGYQVFLTVTRGL